MVVVTGLQRFAVRDVVLQQVLVVQFEAVHRRDDPVRFVLQGDDAHSLLGPGPAQVDTALRNTHKKREDDPSEKRETNSIRS